MLNKIFLLLLQLLKYIIFKETKEIGSIKKIIPNEHYKQSNAGNNIQTGCDSLNTILCIQDSNLNKAD